MRALVGCLAAVLLLAGCTGKPAEPAPTVSASMQGMSHEAVETLAATVLTNYLQISDAIGAEGGRAPERLESVVTPELLEMELETYGSLANRERRTTGATTFDSFELQQVRSQNPLEAVAYACLDISNTRTLDSSGNDVTPERVDRLSIELTFREDGREFKLDQVIPWSGENFC